MASQEFLASFAVEIDEGGVSRLQSVLAENRELAESLASAFSEASSAVHSLTEELGALPGFSAGGAVTEGFSVPGGLAPGLDTGAARKDLQGFLALAKKPVPLSANAGGIVSAARSAYESVLSIFSVPVTLRANVVTDAGGDPSAEHVSPVRKQDRAVPPLRQRLSGLTPAARERPMNSEFRIHNSALNGGLMAGSASAAQITQNNSNVSAPVNIHVHASGVSAEEIGRDLYDTAERYLLRTLRSAFPL